MTVMLLDIEGTTTPISFVYDVLFPYVRRYLADYLRRHWGHPEMQSCASEFARQAALDAADNPDGHEQAAAEPMGSVLSNALAYMDADRKVTCLKTLQGMVWREGYQKSELVGQVYDDVPVALRRWHADRVPVYIYSSGSVDAQQLLFRHSSHGDLTHLLHGYFDTSTGPKRAADSYRAIAASIGQPPSAITFATDILEEAVAAHGAGLCPVLLIRPGNAPLAPHGFPTRGDLLSIAAAP